VNPWKKNIVGKLVKVHVVKYKSTDEVAGVFPTRQQANFYLKDNAVDKDLEIQYYDAFQYDGDPRVSLFDPKAVHFVYQLQTEYHSEEIHREWEIRKIALNKLTSEERRILGV